MPQLHARHLAHRFGRRRLFDDLSFSVAPGEVLVVAGPNGSGKSTLMRILAGLLTPVRGEVDLEVAGEMVDREARPLVTGFVAPYFQVYDGFSVRENLRFIARARRMGRMDERIEAVLLEVGLQTRGDDTVGTLSSGLKQRARFAAALLADPPLLLLDEPTTNLDDDGVAMVEGIVASRRAGGTLLVLATNDRREAAWGTKEIRIDRPSVTSGS
jgi:heme exporter protein A